MSKLYQGLREQGKDKFVLSLKGKKCLNFSRMVNSLLSSTYEARKFLENPSTYFQEKNLPDIKVDKGHYIFERFNLLADKRMDKIILEKDVKSFISILKEYQFLPQKFILQSKKEPQPRAAWVPVIVSPALVYTSLGVMYTSLGVISVAGAVVAAYAWIGVKGRKFQVHQWKSTKIDESVTIALSIALLIGGEGFTKLVDKGICDNFEEEVKLLLDKNEPHVIHNSLNLGF